MEIQAAIARSPDQPFEIATCELAEPARGEVRVRIKACGICHTDLAAKLQHVPVPLPAVLGHEGAGVVERVGPEVTGIEIGDHVLMSFGSCGECANCRSGAPGYCDQGMPLNFLGGRPAGPSIRHGGSPITGNFFCQSSFATHAIATVRNVVKIDKELPLEILAPLGCGIQTGMGSVLHVLQPRAGASLVVFGAGAVGLAAVMAGKVAGCDKILAVDLKEGRLKLANELGASHVINAASEDVAARIGEITEGGVDCALDTTGIPGVVEQAFGSLRTRGRLALVAVAPMGTKYEIDAFGIIASGATVRGVIEGDAVPTEFVPQMVELYRTGRLPLEKLVTTFPFEQINEAIEATEAGDAVKAVLTME